MVLGQSGSFTGKPSIIWFSQYLAQIGGRVQESIEESNWAQELDPLSPTIGFAQANSYTFARRFDRANEPYAKVIADNPTYGEVHVELAASDWFQHRYPQAIQEFAAAARLLSDKNMADFATALEAGFRSGGWPAALRK